MNNMIFVIYSCLNQWKIAHMKDDWSRNNDNVKKDCRILISDYMEDCDKKKNEQKEVPPFGGLEDLTVEEIDKNIEDYPYVLNKLKEC